jgi:hypothetical protein
VLERIKIADAECAFGLAGEYAVLHPSDCRIGHGGPRPDHSGWSAAVDIAVDIAVGIAVGVAIEIAIDIPTAASARPLWTSTIGLRASSRTLPDRPKFWSNESGFRIAVFQQWQTGLPWIRRCIAKKKEYVQREKRCSKENSLLIQPVSGTPSAAVPVSEARPPKSMANAQMAFQSLSLTSVSMPYIVLYIHAEYRNMCIY